MATFRYLVRYFNLLRQPPVRGRAFRSSWSLQYHLEVKALARFRFDDPFHPCRHIKPKSLVVIDQKSTPLRVLLIFDHC